MWKNISYRKRVLYLLTGGFVFLLIIYFGSIKKTIALYNSCSELKEQLTSIVDAPKQIAFYQKKQKETENKVGTISSQGNSHEKILEKCGQYCLKNNLTLRDYPSSFEFKTQNYLIETSSIEIEGGFINLLKLLHNLELDKGLGLISSVSFEAIKDNESNKKVLFEKIYIQNIIKVKD